MTSKHEFSLVVEVTDDSVLGKTRPYRIVEKYPCTDGFRTRITNLSFMTEEEGVAKLRELQKNGT